MNTKHAWAKYFPKEITAKAYMWPYRGSVCGQYYGEESGYAFPHINGVEDKVTCQDCIDRISGKNCPDTDELFLNDVCFGAGLSCKEGTFDWYLMESIYKRIEDQDALEYDIKRQNIENGHSSTLCSIEC